MKNWTCFVWGKSKNSDFVICTIVSSHLLLIVNNIGSWFWMISVTINNTHWRNGDICYMIIFTFFLKWRCIRINNGQHSHHLEKKTICSKIIMKINIHIGKMWKKGRSIKKEIKTCTHIHIICKQKKLNV